MRLLLAAPLVLGACTASTGGATPPVAPSPLLMQYVGEYDAPAAGPVSTLTLHVDGTFEVTGTSGTRRGTFASSGAAKTVSASLEGSDGSTSLATFGASTGSTAGPPRSQVVITGALGPTTLVGPWVAGDESMCRSTGGQWTDDDPDPACLLYTSPSPRD